MCHNIEINLGFAEPIQDKLIMWTFWAIIPQYCYYLYSYLVKRSDTTKVAFSTRWVNGNCIWYGSFGSNLASSLPEGCRVLVWLLNSDWCDNRIWQHSLCSTYKLALGWTDIIPKDMNNVIDISLDTITLCYIVIYIICVYYNPNKIEKTLPIKMEYTIPIN